MRRLNNFFPYEGIETHAFLLSILTFSLLPLGHNICLRLQVRKLELTLSSLSFKINHEINRTSQS